MLSYIPDINVLLACAREDHALHRPAKQWLTQSLLDASNSQSKLTLPMVVLAGFIRIVTHHKIFNPPNTPSEAVTYLDGLVNLPQVSIMDTAAWAMFKTMVLRHELADNAVPDGCLASYALESNAVVVTFDKDFKKLLPKQNLLLLAPL